MILKILFALAVLIVVVVVAIIFKKSDTELLNTTEKSVRTTVETSKTGNFNKQITCLVISKTIHGGP